MMAVCRDVGSSRTDIGIVQISLIPITQLMSRALLCGKAVRRLAQNMSRFLEGYFSLIALDPSLE